MSWNLLVNILGLLVSAAGVYIAFRAVFGDRARGRRRCPKCWYDLRGAEPTPTAPVKCPECGRATTRLRDLQRTRRRPLTALAGLLIIALGHVGGCWISIQQRGWWAAIPRPVLLALVPWTDELPHTSLPGGGKYGMINELWIRTGAADGPHLTWTWPGEHILIRLVTRPLTGEPMFPSRAPARAVAGMLYALAGGTVENAGDKYQKAVAAISRARAKYATLDNYQDSGLTIGRPYSADDRLDTPFITAFQRSRISPRTDCAFRYEAIVIASREISQRYVVWGSANTFQRWWSRDRQSFISDLYRLMGGAHAVTGAQTRIVPAMLTEWEALPDGHDLHWAKVEGKTVIDGAECWEVSDLTDLFPIVYIDCELDVIRAVKFYTNSSYDTIVYRPILNQPIDPNLFSFDPSNPDSTPLGDGEAICRELRPLAPPAPPKPDGTRP